jgi:rod shape-determining protein MreD
MKPVRFSTFFFTMLVGLVFQLYPWSNSGIIIRPDFLLVIAIYWLLQAPYHCNIGWVWFAGLLVDLATGSLLGQHALAFSITAFLGLIYQRRLILFTPWQLYLYVLFLFGAQRLLIMLLKVFAGGEVPDWTYGLPVISDLILWQIMVLWFGALTRPKKL